MDRARLRWIVLLCALSGMLCLPVVAAKVADGANRKPAVACIGIGGPDWALAQKLTKEYDLNVGFISYADLTWERLSRFNAAILFDLSRLNPDTKAVNPVEISPEGFARVSEVLTRFVNEGGGLYIYGVSFTHMGDAWSSKSLNRFLQSLNAQVLFEKLQDPPQEARQPGGMGVLYARADRIVAHPATAGVKNYWYAIGPFSYGPWTRPLKMGPEWTPLIFTSPAVQATPIDFDKGYDTPHSGAVSEVTQKPAAIYAVRTLGKGRIVLNTGESTISFFGYAYSAHADTMWGRIGMEAGLQGVKSDGLPLFVSSLRWLVEPSVASGTLGGFVPAPVKPFVPAVAQPIRWPVARPTGELKYYKGVFCAIPALGGGTGTVAEWVAAAQARGLDFLVIAGDFAKMEQAAWERLVAECKAASTEQLVVTPALISRDDQDNSFLQCGQKAWPRPERLSKKDPKRVQDHLGYWMNDGNFPLRVPFLFSKGQYPAWLHSGYDTFAVRTYQGNTLVEDMLSGFQQNQEQGDRSRIIAMTLLTQPAELAQVQDFTYVLDRDFIDSQFHGGGISYVSSGPRVRLWNLANGVRTTFGDAYVPGTERWRLTLRASSDVPFKQVTIYDCTRIYRRIALTGNTCDLILDGLHDTRHVLTAVIEDVQGGRAVTGAVETLDNLMAQVFCSDRCNLMSGMSTIREADGRHVTVPATSQLYKAGRLNIGTIAKGEHLPGIDGSGGGTAFAWWPDFFLTAEGGKSEERSPIHQINRPYENADLIIFDTPILKRSTVPGHLIFAHNPYVDLEAPKIDARLWQYHFHRRPIYPSPVMGEMAIRVTDPEGVQLKAGWQGFTIRYAGTWGNLMKYIVLRVNGTQEAGPSADEKTGTRWQGTLQPGDALIFPEVGEGMFVLEGEMGVVVECTPSRKWFRAYCGRFDTPKLDAGAILGVRFLNVKMAGPTRDAELAEWVRFREAYGIGTAKPAYAATLTRGKVTATRYLLEMAADGFGVQGTIARADLPQRLPIKVTNLQAQWTAGKVDLERKEWYPLGVWQGAAYTTINTRAGDHTLYIGNLVTADNPDVRVTLLPGNDDGKTCVEVHNPTTRELTVKVRVPVTTFLAAAQELTVTVPPGASVREALR